MKTVVVEPIKVKRLPEIIETHIRNLIIDGKIKAGEQLPTEKEISRQFGVSIVTVREALKGLEVSGLIEKKKGRGGGIFVAKPKSEMVKNTLYNFFAIKKCSIEHLTQARLIIETAVVKIAAKKITKEQIMLLEKNIQYCDTKKEKISSEERKQKNIEFHRLISEATENPILILTTDYVLDFLYEHAIKPLKTNMDFIDNTINDHNNILSKLKVSDSEGAAKSMASHLKNVEKYLK